MKNLIRWNPLDYNNIRVVREISNNSTGTSVAGYANFPGSHGSPIDGIAIEFSAVGNTFVDNSVLVHEMGHYLGLYHTFQGGCANNDCLTDGDHVCDTPPDQSTDAVPCGLSINSCNTDTDSGFATHQDDMVQNFMDYNTPACINQITQGQKDRMLFFVNNDKSSLLNLSACSSLCEDEIIVDISLSTLFPEINETVSVNNNTTNAVAYS